MTELDHTDLSEESGFFALVELDGNIAVIKKSLLDLVPNFNT